MDKIIAYVYNEVLCSIKGNELLVYSTMWEKLDAKDHKLYDFYFIWNAQNKQIHSDKK